MPSSSSFTQSVEDPSTVHSPSNSHIGPRQRVDSSVANEVDMVPVPVLVPALEIQAIISHDERSREKHTHAADIHHHDAVLIPVTDLPHGIVGWEGQDDPRMPLNFSHRRKVCLMLVVSAMSLMTSLSSSMLAPAIERIRVDFNLSSVTVASLPVTIYLLGYAVGPLFLAPMSELYGRAPILTAANMLFCVCHVGNALANSLSALIVSRFLSGVGGSACLTLGGALVADLFYVKHRGAAMAVWAIGPTIGPALGPIIGALAAESIGWHWDGWIVCIPATVITAATALVLPETNHEVLMRRKVERLSKELGRSDLASCYATTTADQKLSDPRSMTIFLKRFLSRPFKMLVFAPIVTIPSVYIAFLYATMYIMYNTIPIVFTDQYGWSLGVTGLVYTAIAVGDATGLAIFATMSDRAVIRQTEANGGVFEPEMRLPAVLPYSVLVSAAFFLYGWSVQYQTHWAVPVLGLVLFGLGTLGVWAPLQTYIVDAYPAYAASSMAGFTVLRSTLGAFLPMAGTAMFEDPSKGGLGLGWGNSVLGFICVALIPVPYVLFRTGRRIRIKYPLKLE